LIQDWKTLPVVKGVLTWVPGFDAWRKYRATTGGTDTPRYCYSVWLRHLTVLDRHGFKIAGARVGELGPGDSIGIGLAALLSGAKSYVGLDIVPFSRPANLNAILDELAELYAKREAIPGEEEFPRVRPRLSSYEFPTQLLDCADLSKRVKTIRHELNQDFGRGGVVNYRAPWNLSGVINAGSLDLIYSQAVLEHVDDLEHTYSAMALWLKPGGYASHVIDFTSHGLSPFWNGHWAYSDFEWRLVRGRREFLLNREPLSTHLACARKAGLEVIFMKQQFKSNGLKSSELAGRFRELAANDVRTSSVILLLYKPRRTMGTDPRRN
jgi:SAM-dependent methyltransferase